MFRPTVAPTGYITIKALAKELGYAYVDGLRPHAKKITGHMKVQTGALRGWVFPDTQQTRDEIAAIGMKSSFKNRRGQKRMPAGAAARLRHLEMGEW